MAAGGRKLPDDVEAAIEDETANRARRARAARPRCVDIASRSGSTSTSIISAPRSTAARSTVCASSSTAPTAPRRRSVPRALRRLGADVVVLHAEPDGRNINEQCGSTHPAGPADRSARARSRSRPRARRRRGPGDRGRRTRRDRRRRSDDGCARDRSRTSADRLRNDAVAVTVMSNLGLRRALRGGRHRDRRDAGRRPQRPRRARRARPRARWRAVGARHLPRSRDDRRRCAHGSARVRPRAPVGPARSRRSPRRWRGSRRCSSSVPVCRVARPWRRRPRSRDEVLATEAALGDRGRVLVRASGTEPVVRVMVEAPTESEAEAAVARAAPGRRDLLRARSTLTLDRQRSFGGTAVCAESSRSSLVRAIDRRQCCGISSARSTARGSRASRH